MKKEIEILSHKIANHQFNSPTKLKNAKEKRDTLVFDIKRLERTLENIDPRVQADININMIERHMNAEINQMKSMTFVSSTSSTFTKTGEIEVLGGGAKQQATNEYVDWSSSGSYSRGISKKGIWVKERPKKKY